MDLVINGREALLSGSIMIPAGKSGALVVPGGQIKLTFLTSGDPGFRLENWELVVTSPDNPLGIAFEFPLGADGNQKNIVMAMTVHTVGEAEKAHRIVHYTAYHEA